ncbi:Two-component system histidine kinase DccS [hydrothermal vent metagenome]|uniref:Two-component system histidine kinase DccS n=1 Tax=hydrothermal vent metagenome TaxID=652676 RepID=A0A1W1EKI5_9ZZZZ
MLALKNRATNSILNSERKSLLRFLTLYILMSIIVIFLLSLFYYQYQDKLNLANHRTQLSIYADDLIRKLKDSQIYPEDDRFKSAIYDINYLKIFSILDEQKVYFHKEIYRINDKIHFVKVLDNDYLGAKYLIIEIDDNNKWVDEVISTIILYGVLALIFLAFLGLYLSRLFLKPMRDYILLLDTFIKDTTHELNTPLSTILANIEMMDREIMVEKNIKKLHRINIAAKTISNIYNDLTYLILTREKVSENENVNIDKIIYDRVDYFDILASSKKIEFKVDLIPIILYIDREKVTRVVDNLISNAIKYNKRGGFIEIKLRENYLTISDTGIGIEESKIPYIFDRYRRFNQSEGGFGIGLSIVKDILNEYNIYIEVNSKLKEGTKIVLKW